MVGYTTFLEYILNCLYCLFVEAPRLGVFGTDSRVGKFVLCGKLFKFFRGVLRAVIGDDYLGNAVSTEEGLDFIDNGSGFGVPKFCYLRITTVVVNNDQMGLPFQSNKSVPIFCQGLVGSSCGWSCSR